MAQDDQQTVTVPTTSVLMTVNNKQVSLACCASWLAVVQCQFANWATEIQGKLRLTEHAGISIGVFCLVKTCSTIRLCETNFHVMETDLI